MDFDKLHERLTELFRKWGLVPPAPVPRPVRVRNDKRRYPQ
jgi:hypothetical protein